MSAGTETWPAPLMTMVLEVQSDWERAEESRREVNTKNREVLML